MCGIFFKLKYGDTKSLDTSLLSQIQRRGPDAYKGYKTTIINKDGKVFDLHFYGTVLHFRGMLTSQPLLNDQGDILLWNGEVFGGLDVPRDENDTKFLLEKLQTLKDDNDFIKLFSLLQGPWAYVYFDVTQEKLWYGRDYFGRRSLLQTDKNNSFVLSSVGHREDLQGCVEVPAKFLYCINLKNIKHLNDLQDCTTKFSFKAAYIPRFSFLNEHRCLSAIHLTKNFIANNGLTHLIKTDTCTKSSSYCHLCYSRQKKFKTCSKTSKINKEDCTKTSLTLGETKNFIDNDIELKNSIANHGKTNPTSVNVEGNKVVNTNTDDHSRYNTCSDVDKDINTAVKEDILVTKCCDCLEVVEHNDSNHYADTAIDNTISTECVSSSLKKINFIDSHNELPSASLLHIRDEFLNILQESVRTRVFNLPRSTSKEAHSNVGILFSGGIDSAVITALAHRCVPEDESIDLINVAFQQKVKQQQGVKKKYQKTSQVDTLNFDVPDRITGRKALLELPRSRRWNYIEVDVTLGELQKQREEVIANLVYPLESVLDDSIGCAIWYAARGTGKRYNISTDGEFILQEESYTSPVKVLLTGMGADEQLGGYARHRTKYESSGWIGLSKEMKMEIDRISSRNLGRDDRCISDHGREARFPFLDENVVWFLSSLPVCVKCDPRLPRGVGEKILLREVALILGLQYASQLPKRAIQFGSRIAKLESSKEKGNQTCNRLKSTE